MRSIELILKDKTAQFSDQIKKLADMSQAHHFSNKAGGFPVFFENQTYNEQSFFEERIENAIWKILVNDILKDMFCDEYCASKGIAVEWKRMHPQITYSYVEKTEEKYPLEFVVVSDGKRTGYRYTNCYWLEEQMEAVFKNNSLDDLRIIDFSSDKISSFMHPIMVSPKYRSLVAKVTLRDFFVEFFSEEEYDTYLSNVQTAVLEAYRYVGLQTVPNMTLQYMAYFIKKELKEISGSYLGSQEYKVINIDDLKDGLKDRVNRASDVISADDYKIMDENFYNHGRYYAMCGGEAFAHSFLTSEYLYKTMQSNNHFDYTAVVAGYLKSIEQLLYKTVLFTLNNGTERELWIKYRYVKAETQPETRNFNNTKHVRFVPENEKFFDTAFTPLVNLLNVNVNGWSVSKKARNRIITCLNVFCAECRNEHFHKDNISIEDIDEVKTIRHNTMILFYYILGAYAFSGDAEKDKEVLGIKDRRYDEMYQAIMAQSAGGDYFILSFADDQQILCAFPMNHGAPEYDESGLMKNPKLRFVKVNRDIDDDWHNDNWSFIEDDTDSASNLYITPQNMPVKIQYVDKVSGKRIDIEW